MLGINEQTLEDSIPLILLIDKCKKDDELYDLEALRAEYANRHSVVDLILHGRKDLEIK